MYPSSIIHVPGDDPDSPMVDMEFDSFELNCDLEPDLRKAETATFYHDSFDPEE